MKGERPVRGQASNSTDPSVGNTRATAPRIPGVLGLIALALLMGSANLALAGNQGDLILNEINAVSDSNILKDGGEDSFLGQVQGNGGNWLELVVIADHLDIRAWTLEWANDDPDGGTVVFSNHSIWSDLRSGTIITIREDDLSPPGYGVLLSDLSYDPTGGDWWIHANVDDEELLAQDGFKVDDDCWRMRILDAESAVIQGWVGEQDQGPPACPANNLWGGTGNLSNTEVGKLEQDPSRAAAYPPASPYNDGTSSTFGSGNVWQEGVLTQDFSALRDAISVPALTTKGAALLVGLLVGSVFWPARRRASAV
jgi:hypothetical protein